MGDLLFTVDFDLDDEVPEGGPLSDPTRMTIRCARCDEVVEVANDDTFIFRHRGQELPVSHLAVEMSPWLLHVRDWLETVHEEGV